MECGILFINLMNLDEYHTHVIILDQHLRDRTQFRLFRRKGGGRKISTTFHSDGFRLIFFKLEMITDTTKLYTSTPILMTLGFFQGHSCIRKHKLLRSFSRKFLKLFRLNEFSVLQ